MRPDADTSALRTVVCELMDTRQGNTYFVKMISGVAQHYDRGDGDTHPWVGRRMPDVALDDGTRLSGRCLDGCPVLLDTRDDPAPRDVASGWADRLHVITSPAVDHPDLSALLVRPDGYVAWAAHGPAELDALRAALGRWFGAALAAPVG